MSHKPDPSCFVALIAPDATFRQQSVLWNGKGLAARQLKMYWQGLSCNTLAYNCFLAHLAYRVGVVKNELVQIETIDITICFLNLEKQFYYYSIKPWPMAYGISVDSLSRDGANAQYMQYLRKSRITSPQIL